MRFVKLFVLVALGMAVLFVYGAIKTVSPYHAGMFLLACGGGYIARVLYVWLTSDHEPRRNTPE